MTGFGPIVQLKRVVVTGVGLVTPLGVGREVNWSALKKAKCGIRRLEDPKFARLPCRLAAGVPEGSECGQFDWSDHFAPSERRQISRGIALSIVAAREAWTDSGRRLPDPKNETFEDYGVCFGQGMVDLDDVHEAGTFIDNRRQKRISPYFVPRILTNMAAGAISIRFGLLVSDALFYGHEMKSELFCSFHGPNHAVSTACTTGAHAIGDAFNLIRLGMADVGGESYDISGLVFLFEAVLCGGADACISPISLAGFARCRALSTSFHDDPHAASRPFDKSRDGFVMGEGAGCVLLESLEHFEDRTKREPSVRVYAEVLGYGLSGDAHHVTAPDMSGRGASLCMQRAIKDSRLSPRSIDYVNAHATSTPLGDRIEANAIGEIFHGHQVHVSSTKGHTGHLLGAAGAVESIYTILAVHNGWIPPTLNLDELDISADSEEDMSALDHVDFVKDDGHQWTNSDGRRVALSNSFGFGGTNASLCFAQFNGSYDSFYE